MISLVASLFGCGTFLPTSFWLRNISGEDLGLQHIIPTNWTEPLTIQIIGMDQLWANKQRGKKNRPTTAPITVERRENDVVFLVV